MNALFFSTNDQSEIRNIIYRLIGDDVGECYHLSGPRPRPTSFRIEGGKGKDCHPLSLTRLSPEVASEYLSLLLFHNASSDQMRPDAPLDAVNWHGSLDFPHFNLHTNKDIQEITSGSGYNRYDDGGEPGGRLDSWFDADWYDSQIKQISLTFILYRAEFQLTQASLDLIDTTLQRTFVSNKDITFEKFAAAADQLAHLNLTAVRISDWSAEPADPEVVCFTVMSSSESEKPFIGMEDGDSYDIGLFWAMMSGIRYRA